MSRYTSDKQKAAEWASRVLAMQSAIIFDTETTDLDGEIIELAIINMAGEVLYNGRFKPIDPISPGAYKVHGISAEMLADCPSWAEEWGKIRPYFEAADLVLSYNVGFDCGVMANSHMIHGTDKVAFQRDCIMLRYAAWYGEPKYRGGGYKWQPLIGGDHSALGDARAALAVLQKMAKSAQPVQDGLI